MLYVQRERERARAREREREKDRREREREGEREYNDDRDGVGKGLRFHEFKQLLCKWHGLFDFACQWFHHFLDLYMCMYSYIHSTHTHTCL
jgi:hypothetical protein